MKLQSITISGKKGQEVESAIFDRVGDAKLVAQAVRVYLSNQRSGTAKTKTRAEVNLTKKKWFKQKHTGNARHGAQSAPIFVGGGVSHGPHGNANWKLSMSKMMRTRALESALNVQATAEKLSIVEGLEKISGKTKDMIIALKALELSSKAVLLITDDASDELLRSTQNVGNVLVVNARDINTYIIARAQSILITPEGLSALESRLGARDAKKATTADTLKAKKVKKVEKVEKKPAVKKTTVKKTVKKTEAKA